MKDNELKMIKNCKKIFLFILLAFSLNSVADNATANREFQIALQEFNKRDYTAAAKRFLAAELYADNIVLKANSVKKAAESYRKAKIKYKEFDCLEKLLTSYLGYVNFDKIIQREFELADDFFKGHRDTLSSWFTWLKKPSKTIEAYEKVLKHAPYAKKAPVARLRLARLYVKKNKNDQALETLQDVIKMHPETEAQRDAFFELANLYFQLAQRGDGDGKYADKTRELLQTIIKKYPKDKELDWAKVRLGKIDDICAKRLYEIAIFYHRSEKNKVAAEYLEKIIKKYSKSKHIKSSKKLLKKINKIKTFK